MSITKFQYTQTCTVPVITGCLAHSHHLVLGWKNEPCAVVCYPAVVFLPCSLLWLHYNSASNPSVCVLTLWWSLTLDLMSQFGSWFNPQSSWELDLSPSMIDQVSAHWLLIPSMGRKQLKWKVKGRSKPFTVLKIIFWRNIT